MFVLNDIYCLIGLQKLLIVEQLNLGLRFKIQRMKYKNLLTVNLLRNLGARIAIFSEFLIVLFAAENKRFSEGNKSCNHYVFSRLSSNFYFYKNPILAQNSGKNGYFMTMKVGLSLRRYLGIL